LGANVIEDRYVLFIGRPGQAKVHIRIINEDEQIRFPSAKCLLDLLIGLIKMGYLENYLGKTGHI
jgi:hypothetical protein